MLKIRLARAGRHKTPFFRIVLTEHTRHIQSGYQDILGFYDPLKHKVTIDVEASKAWIAKGAKPTSRVAKILHQHTGDDFFKKYIVITERTRKSKNAPAEEETPKAPVAAPAPQAEEPKAEAPKVEEVAAPVEQAAEAPAPEVVAEAPAPQEPAAEAEQAEEESK